MEEAREILNKTIERYGLGSIEVLRASQEMDQYIHEYMKRKLKK